MKSELRGFPIKELSKNEEQYIEATVCDWDAEDRATLEKYLEVSTIEARISQVSGSF